jgi:hypothetical protein
MLLNRVFKFPLSEASRRKSRTALRQARLGTEGRLAPLRGQPCNLLHEEINKEYKDKHGPMADFMKCYRGYLQEEIGEAKMRDRRWQRLEDYSPPLKCPKDPEGWQQRR